MCADDPMFPQVELSEPERLVMNAIRACPGLGFAISKEDLGKQLDMDERVLQEHIAHLVTEHDYPIGSATGTPHGYYWITSPEELARSKQQLRNRVINNARRLAALEGVAHYEILGQLSLELKQEPVRV